MRLDDFLKNKDIVEFFSENWSIAPYHFSASPLHLETPAELLPTLLSLPRLRYPQVRVLNANGALNPLNYTASSRYGFSEVLESDKVIALAVAPNTIKIENLASLDPIFENWAKLLEHMFSSRITLNGYFSFGPSEGIPTHYDPHHIFAIQLYGEKIWNLGVTQSESFPHNALTMTENLVLPPTTELKLRAGEMLYVPPGRLHSVRTEQQSVHITAGIHTPRCFETLSSLLEKAAMRHPELRADLPLMVNGDALLFRSFSKEELDIVFELIKAEHYPSELSNE